MSITSSLYTGKSALLSYGNSLSIIGHNLANANTVGFKASRAEFSNLISTLQTEGEIGHGVRLGRTTQPLLQGALETTGTVTDLALQGPGLFIVNDADGKSLYTRAGEFTLNDVGDLVHPTGFNLQGFELDATGTATGGLVNIALADEIILPPSATTTINLSVNLDATATTPGNSFPADAVGTEDSSVNWISASNFQAVVRIHDSLGLEHDLSYFFRRSSTVNEWDYRIAANGGEIVGGTAGQLRQVSAAGGQLAFNSDGTLNSGGTTSIGQIGPIAWNNGSTAQTIAPAGLNFSNTTQFALRFGVKSLSQDGTEQGIRTGIEIDEFGIIRGRFSNGGDKELYQIALADFPGDDRLDPIGSTFFVESLDSGAATVGTPGTNGFGSLVSGGLERSNVDLALEFVGLITSQRAFQVNSRVITVADRMYEEAANLKR